MIMNKRTRMRNTRRTFNCHVEVQKDVGDEGSYGQQKEEFEEFIQVMADVKNLYGKEYFAAKAVNAEKTVKFIVRWSEGKDITEDMRLIMNGEIYDIAHIDNINYENDRIEIKATKVGVVDESSE